MRAAIILCISVVLLALPGDVARADAAHQHYLKGLRLRRAKRYKAAEAEFRKAIRLRPSYLAAHLGLAHTLRRMRRP